MFKKGFTMLELIIALAIIAILALITVPIAKNKLSKVDKFSYYLAYAAVQDIAANIVAQSEYEYEPADLADASDLFGERLAMYTPAFEYLYAINDTIGIPYMDGNQCKDEFGNLLPISFCTESHAGGGGAGGSSSGGTHCISPFKLVGGRCVCSIIAPANAILNSSACTWTCKSGYHQVGQACVRDSETCSKTCSGNLTLNSNTCSCECNITPPANATLNRLDCTWTCNEGYIKKNGMCIGINFKPDDQIDPIDSPVTPDPEPDTPTECSANQYKNASGVCENCSDISTWNMYKTVMPPCPVNCEKFGMVYNTTKGTCIMPAAATNFCERIKTEYNIRNSACDVTADQMRTNTASGFKDVTPHIKLSNGLQIYIASDLVKINELEDAVDVRDRVGYLVYVDVNGNKGKGILYQDVFPFYIMMTGKILPLYNPDGVGGANSVENLSGNIIYDDYSTGNRVVKASQTKVDYQTGVCATKYIQSANYCKSIPVDAHCADSNADCRYIVNKPMRFFGR